MLKGKQEVKWIVFVVGEGVHRCIEMRNGSEAKVKLRAAKVASQVAHKTGVPVNATICRYHEALGPWNLLPDEDARAY